MVGFNSSSAKLHKLPSPHTKESEKEGSPDGERVNLVGFLQRISVEGRVRDRFAKKGALLWTSRKEGSADG